jgi:hypothetical protein
LFEKAGRKLRLDWRIAEADRRLDERTILTVLSKAGHIEESLKFEEEVCLSIRVEADP